MAQDKAQDKGKKKYTVAPKRRVNHDGDVYEAGEEIELTSKHAGPLLNTGAITGNEPEEATTEDAMDELLSGRADVIVGEIAALKNDELDQLLTKERAGKSRQGIINAILAAQAQRKTN